MGINLATELTTAYRKDASEGGEIINAMKKDGFRGKLVVEDKNIGKVITQLYSFMLLAMTTKDFFLESDPTDFKNENEYLEYANFSKFCHEALENDVVIDITYDLAMRKFKGDKEKTKKYLAISLDLIKERVLQE